MNELNALIPRFILEKLFQWFFEPQDMETREGGDASESESGITIYSRVTCKLCLVEFF